MFACAPALIAQEYQGRERASAFGVWGATIGAAVAVGPLVGGALTEHLGWEWIFFVNVPIGALTVIVTLLKLNEYRPETRARIDWAGVVTFSGGLFCLVFALIRGNAEGWGSAMILGLLAASAALLIAFVVVERHGSHPMLDLALFRKPAFTGAQIAAFSISASMFSMFLYLTLYMQNVLRYSPFQAGLRFLPVSVLSFVAAPLAARLAQPGAGARADLRRARGRRHRPAAHGRRHALLDVDHAAGRLPHRGCRRRLRQRPAQLRGGERRRGATQRHRLRDQQHLPPGGHRHRHRGAGRRLPVARDGPAGDAARGRAGAARGRGPPG